MTDEETGYLANNLWLYRLRRRKTRRRMAIGIVKYDTYREYEYGSLVPPIEEVKKFAARLQTSVEALTRPPDYQWLLSNYRIRKVLEYYCLLERNKHQNAIHEILRALSKTD